MWTAYISRVRCPPMLRRSHLDFGFRNSPRSGGGLYCWGSSVSVQVPSHLVRRGRGRRNNGLFLFRCHPAGISSCYPVANLGTRARHSVALFATVRRLLLQQTYRPRRLIPLRVEIEKSGA